MGVEERIHDAISITRDILMDALDDVGAVLQMTIDCTTPEDVENQVAMILKYLDRTEPEGAVEGEG